MASRPDRPADEPPAGDDDGRLPDPDGRVSDEQWAAIVAELRAADDPDAEPGPTGATGVGPSSGPAVTYPVAPWVSDRRVVRPARGEGAPTGDDDTAPASVPGFAGTGRDWDGTGSIDEAERLVDAEEGFVAPDPGPVLGGDPLLTTAWFAVAGMPVLWLVVLIGWRDAPSVVLQASVAVFLLGLVVLLWRMPHRRDEDADDDTGAVV